MLMYTDDPIADFNRYDAEQAQAMAKYPVCADCGKSITGDFVFYIEGDIYCEDCMLDNFRRPTDDFIEGEW